MIEISFSSLLTLVIMFEITRALREEIHNNFLVNNKIFINFFRLHGLIPCNFGTTNLVLTFIFKTHTLLIVIGLWINLIFITQSKDYTINVGGVSWFAEIIVWFGVCWVIIVGYIEIFATSKTQKQLISQINHLDTLLRDDLKCFIHYRALRSYKYLKYGVIQLIIWTTMLIIFRNVFLTNFWQYYFQLLMTCHFVYIISMMLIFYFDSVHDRLEICLQKIRVIMEKESKVWFTKKERLHERLLSKLEVKQVILVGEIKGMAEEIFKLLNLCFGWTLVFLFVMFGIEVICNAYWIFLAVSSAVQTTTIIGTLLVINF